MFGLVTPIRNTSFVQATIGGQQSVKWILGAPDPLHGDIMGEIQPKWWQAAPLRQPPTRFGVPFLRHMAQTSSGFSTSVHPPKAKTAAQARRVGQ